MNLPEILRLQGAGPDLIWPADIDPIIGRISELRRKCEWYRALEKAQRRAALSFGAAQRWHLSDGFRFERLLRKRGTASSLSWSSDVFDHPVFYRQHDGDVALLIQPYRGLSCDEVPAELTVDLLPDSFHYPYPTAETAGTVAYVLRPAPLGRPLALPGPSIWAHN